jgi:hypothetical protein
VEGYEMKSGKITFLLGVCCGVATTIASAFVLRGTVDAQEPGPQWLNPDPAGALVQIENQFRGFDQTMSEVGYRFTELYFAGEDRNWPYAEYQLEKIEHTIRLGLERRPKRAASAQEFLNEVLPDVVPLVKEHDPAAFSKAMDRLKVGCMTCHVAEELPHFIVKFPTHRIAPIDASEGAADATVD